MHSATGAVVWVEGTSFDLGIKEGWLDSIVSDNMNAGLILSMETHIPLPCRCRLQILCLIFSLNDRGLERSGKSRRLAAYSESSDAAKSELLNQ
ncbi:hypothetical protein TNIN_74591 [Trichonephila inaurata madagascariensis]|uniref:Uncharacterized protein n=1 Tax=Trichonephila inaurata madagascariensis TaxID=2747483 RepID=A0A8X6I9F7_9ARAC|nr:hypothetical protein TNIN_74591 [Trichonephila inaurata madagascariensis]